MSKSKYAHFFVQKILKYGSKEQKNIVFKPVWTASTSLKFSSYIFSIMCLKNIKRNEQNHVLFLLNE